MKVEVYYKEFEEIINPDKGEIIRKYSLYPNKTRAISQNAVGTLVAIKNEKGITHKILPEDNHLQVMQKLPRW